MKKNVRRNLFGYFLVNPTTSPIETRRPRVVLIKLLNMIGTVRLSNEMTFYSAQIESKGKSVCTGAVRPKRLQMKIMSHKIATAQPPHDAIIFHFWFENLRAKKFTIILCRFSRVTDQYI